jgi:hypothetical protein
VKGLKDFKGSFAIAGMPVISTKKAASTILRKSVVAFSLPRE